jgi:hypothetical protein
MIIKLMKLTILEWAKYTQKQLFDILEVNFMFEEFVIRLYALRYSIYGMPSILL